MRTRIRLKLARAGGMKKSRVGFDLRKLQSEEIRRRYNVEVKNRFEVLGDIEDPEEEHDKILETYRDAAKKVLGWSKKQSKTWIGDKTWEKLRRGKRQNLKWKAKIRAIKTEKEARIQCEKQVSETKNWMEGRAAAAEKAAENGRNKELYNITKTIAGQRKRQEVGVKDKQGVLKTQAQEGLQRWGGAL